MIEDAWLSLGHKENVIRFRKTFIGWGCTRNLLGYDHKVTCDAWYQAERDLQCSEWQSHVLYDPPCPPGQNVLCRLSIRKKQQQWKSTENRVKASCPSMRISSSGQVQKMLSIFIYDTWVNSHCTILCTFVGPYQLFNSSESNANGFLLHIH